MSYDKYLWNYNTDQQEISVQYLDNENVSGDAVLWRHNKSKMADGRHFVRYLNHHISVKNHPILIKFGTLKQLLKPITVTWPKLKFLGWWRPPSWKYLFLVITHQPIVRFQRNFVRRSRTACRQGLHDKNFKFLKSKMADGRHFENRKIAISPWKIVTRDQEFKFLKFKTAVPAILKIAFLAISHQPIVRFQRNFVWGSSMACRQWLHDKTANF